MVVAQLDKTTEDAIRDILVTYGINHNERVRRAVGVALRLGTERILCLSHPTPDLRIVVLAAKRRSRLELRAVAIALYLRSYMGQRIDFVWTTQQHLDTIDVAHRLGGLGRASLVAQELGVRLAC